MHTMQQKYDKARNDSVMRNEITQLSNGKWLLRIYNSKNEIEHEIEKQTQEGIRNEIFRYMYKGGNKAISDVRDSQFLQVSRLSQRHG